MNIKETDKNYVAGTYARWDVVITSGKGSILKDEAGKEYIDLGSGIAVNSFGIGDNQWKKAVTDQLDKIQHTSNLCYTEPEARLAQILCQKTGMKKVFFANSGAEANECAIKVARKYNSDNYGGKRQRIITLKNSFHGRTLTTLSATGQPSLQKGFEPMTPGFTYVPANDYGAFYDEVEKGDVGAIMMELIQGEGGMLVMEKEYVERVATLCQEKDVLLLIDEVQTGNGRTGTFYSYMQYGLEPDVVSTAKGIGGGLPIGATLMNHKTENVLSAGTHGSTYGGNPICAAGAINIVERMDDAFLRHVAEKGKMAMEAFEGAPGVRSVSGMGLMFGIETERPVDDVLNEARDAGVIIIKAKDKLRFIPALNIPVDVMKKGIDILKKIMAK